MGAIQRIKELVEQGLTEDEAYDQVVQGEHHAAQDYWDAMADYEEGWWGWV